MKINLRFCTIEQKSADTLYLSLVEGEDIGTEQLNQLYQKLEENCPKPIGFLLIKMGNGSFLMGNDRDYAVHLILKSHFNGIAVITENIASRISASYFQVALDTHAAIRWFGDEKTALAWFDEIRIQIKKAK